MPYLVCDHETPPRTGVRIHASGVRQATHPAYSGLSGFYCRMCGNKLRRIDSREFKSLVEAGAGSGA